MLFFKRMNKRGVDMEEKVIIRLEHVCKDYGKKAIIKNFSLDIYESEIITFLGPSGCGKTTILRMISGLESVTSGKIFIDGIDMEGIDAKDREVNTIFQSYALFPHLSVYDNIAFGLKMKKEKKEFIQKRVKEMLKLVNLQGYEKRYPHELSGGEQQRVAIARALINKPKVLLLDEPLSALDKKLKKQMRIELKELQQKLGITFVYVTHDQSEALSLSDRILLMHNGRIVQLATPYELYEHPKTKFAADFIGDANIFTGVVTELQEQTAMVLIDDLFSMTIKNDNYQVGESLTLVIRPENMSVITTDKTYNLLEVEMHHFSYDGAYYTVFVKSELKKELKLLLTKEKFDHIKGKKTWKVFFDLDDIVVIRGNKA